MNRRIFALAVLLLLGTATIISARDGGNPNKPPVPRPECLQGVLIIKLRPDVANSRASVRFGVAKLDEVMTQLGIVSRKPLMPNAPYPALPSFALINGSTDYGFERIYLVYYASPFDARQAARMVAATGAVDYAEPHWIFKLCYTPNDPLLSQQYWLNIIHAQEAWDITKGDTNIVIGVCDTGVEWTHEDLLGNIVNRAGEIGLDGLGRDKRSNGVDDDGDGYVDDWHGWDFVGNATLTQLQSGQWFPDNNPAPTPVAGDPSYGGYHGTWVSGCASAQADNGKGVAGVGFRVKILPIKCTADSVATSSVLAGYQGITYGADAGARIINCSWGGRGVAANQIQALQDVVNYAYSKGVLVVAAAGNAGSNNDLSPSYPANLNHVLSVGATTAADSAANFSEYGFSVGVWAPGVAVYTTTVGGNRYTSSGVDGTSFSSPITAGVAALVYSVHPAWTSDQVAMQLRVTGDRVKVRQPVYGPLFYRRVNAFRAVSINQTFSGTGTLPGIGMVSFKINGKTTDTLTAANQPIDVQVTLKNYLAPTSNLTITAEPNQTLTTVQPSYPVAALGTMEQSVQTLRVKLNPSATVLYSEGVVPLLLKLTDGQYEDYVRVSIPVSLPGWHQQYDPNSSGSTTNYTSASICSPSVDVAWAAANAAIPTAIRTADGGKSWSSYRPVASTNELIYCIAAVDKDMAWAGSGPANGQAGVFRTVSGGSTWLRAGVGAITPFVDAIHFFDAKNGIFIGDPLTGKWGIGVTADGGATWSPLSAPVNAGSTGSGTEAGWNNALAAFGDNLWFGTNNSRIYHSTNRGQTWSFAPTLSINSLSIAFANANDGMALFRLTQTNGTFDIEITHNGGTSWSSVAMPFAGAQPTGISFVPGTTRAFVGTQNGMYETSDFGTTWKPMAMPVVSFADLQVAAASNGQGTIAGYGVNTAGQLMAYREVPPAAVRDDPESGAVGNAVIATLQAIPNPFAVSTTISFELRAAATDATLTFHDAAGRVVLVKTLGALNAGVHSVDVDGVSLPGGAYLYTLSAGGYSLTRRMMVVK